MIVWAKAVDGKMLETLTAAQAVGVFPEAPDVEMMLVDVSVSEWQRARIGTMMVRGKQALKDGSALEKKWRKREKATDG